MVELDVLLLQQSAQDLWQLRVILDQQYSCGWWFHRRVREFKKAFAQRPRHAGAI